MSNDTASGNIPKGTRSRDHNALADELESDTLSPQATPNRRSSRRREQVNYDIRRHYKRGSSLKEPLVKLNGSKLKTEKHTELDKSSNPIYSSYISPPLITEPKSQLTKIPILKENLANIIVDNTRKIDELFQLMNFTSLVSFDPQNPNINKDSELYKSFLEEYDLWSKRDHSESASSSRRRNIRRGPAVNPVQEEIEQIVKDRLLLQAKEEIEPSPRKRSRSTMEHSTTPKSRKTVDFTPLKRNGTRRRLIKSEEQEDWIDEKSSRRKNGIKQEDSEDENVSEEDEWTDSELEEMLEEPVVEEYKNVKRIKPILQEPKGIITHPSHVTKPKFNNLTDFLNSYKSLDEDLSLEEYDLYMEDQNRLVSRIRDAVKNKTLRIDFNENVDRTHWNQREEPTMIKPALKVVPFKDPIKMFAAPTHHDYLLAQGIHSAKLFKDMRRARTQRCKRIAQMIETYFKRKSMAKEREQKDFEVKMMRMAKETARMVKRKWLQAEKAWKILEDRRKEQERVKRGKQHLTEMLEHSTHLLEQQMNNKSSSTTRQTTPDNVESEDKHGSDSSLHDFSGSENDSDELSDSDEENEKQVDDLEDDSKLSVEALRAKYRDLEDQKLESDSNGSLAALYSENDISVKPEEAEITEEEKKAIASEEPYNSLLDSDTSDSDDSMNSSEEEDSELESGSELEKLTPTLASLFGGGVQEEDSDDESVKSEDEDMKPDTPISTPDEENTDNGIISKASDAVTNEQVNNVPDVPVPPLLRGTLRIYQKQGLNWLAGLYNNNTNGILADEMGLGKTIQTISLITYLACEKHIWGPHLIVVPTSVMLNWEMEFKRFAPGMKVLTYYGSPQQRKEKRKGWNSSDAFHVCITSYQLVVHDHHAFRRKKWRYMILDEAHNIKNFRSQRWQALLNFNTEHRLLLTGTPLQNSIMELWSLLYFLMPSTKADQSMPAGFANLQDFQQWFGRPVDKIVEGGGTSSEADDETRKTVSKLHQVLRPYLLRRLKADVEKQMPAKYEHIVYCRLSKRQRYLYDDFMSRAQTKETLASGNFLSIINCLMQLRKVCNHPDLFEVRPIVTSFAMQRSVPSGYELKELIVRRNLNSSREQVDLNVVNAITTGNDFISTSSAESFKKLNGSNLLQAEIKKLEAVLAEQIPEDYQDLERYYEYMKYKEQEEALSHTQHIIYLNNLRCEKTPVYGSNLLKLLTIKSIDVDSNAVKDMIKPLETRSLMMKDTIEKYAFVTPLVVTLDMKSLSVTPELREEIISTANEISNPFHQAQVKLSIAFPDKSLLQYDCGKLQKLASLLMELKDNGHRALIFTQMTKVLDILELFLSYHGYRYMRLDGATKIEDRQILTERFNTDNRITCFILSTRSGGLGINLTGADTVIFYDSDWNPAMDKQCQDRCHRIGQTRDVHIYRFVSEFTIESNILRKANQKRQLDNVVIQEGDFTTDYFGKLSVSDLLGEEIPGATDTKPLAIEDNPNNFTAALAQAEDADDAAAANVAMKEVELDNADFDELKSNSATPAPDRTTPVKPEETEDIEEDFDEDDVGHIDEYMIRFIEGGYYWD